MSKDKNEDDEIVPSGEALRTVASWLGVSNVEDVMEKEGLNPEYEMGRVQGLGLGAKFLPHHKAVALTTGVEHRLSSKLKRSAERQCGADPASGLVGMAGSARSLQQHGFGGRSTWPKHKKGGRQEAAPSQPVRGGGGGTIPAAAAATEEGDEGSSEDEGRGRAFGKGKEAAQRLPTFSRSDLLKTVAASQGKKRKRKGGSSGGGGSGGGGSVAQAPPPPT